MRKDDLLVILLIIVVSAVVAALLVWLSPIFSYLFSDSTYANESNRHHAFVFSSIILILGILGLFVNIFMSDDKITYSLSFILLTILSGFTLNSLSTPNLEYTDGTKFLTLLTLLLAFSLNK